MPYKTNKEIQQAMDIRQILNTPNVQRPLPPASINNPDNQKMHRDLRPDSVLSFSEALKQAKRRAVATAASRSRTIKSRSTGTATPQVQPSHRSEASRPSTDSSALPTHEGVATTRERANNNGSVTPPQPIAYATFTPQISLPVAGLPSSSSSPHPRPAPNPRGVHKPNPKPKSRRGRVGGKELHGLKDWLSAPETTSSSVTGSGGRTSWNSRSTWV
ncbi:MAG: hypothetical protein HETSPECPRED_006057 [Heterodermia speciosa]|uniref:Uncharacterized protein n=1 Tax=Heterodermia speciosa TaxID=116794 RepID=A0A8H3EIA2_9LECA|nr:MAG: hypothetical protein HETSPECPRED_006057 [Heterodermia speciosa]